MSISIIPASAADTDVTDTPVIWQLTDDVKPGNGFTVSGWALTKDTVVYIEDATTAGETPSDAARILKPTVYDKLATQFVICVLPEGIKAGNYKVWAKTKNGISNYEILNAARPFWVGESDIAWEGQTIQIVGSSFMADHHGAENNTKVKLTVDGTDYPCEITNLEPYSLRFTVPAGIKTGKCDISVTNNGVNWTTMEDHQNFTIVPVGNDPYGLDVAWAGNYVYDYRVNVKELGAKGDGVTDDTAAFAEANRLIKANGGGVVYIPNGKYNITLLDMPAYVVYEGESKENTILHCMCTDPNQPYWIGSSAESLSTGYQGFYNVSFLKDEETGDIFADATMWIGHPWSADIDGATYQNQNKVFCGFFMKNCDMETIMTHKSQTGRGLMYATGKKYFMIDGYDGYGWSPSFMPTTFSYATGRNIYLRPMNSSNEWNGSFTIFEGNTVEMQTQYTYEPWGTGPHAQCMFCRTEIYVAHNTFKHSGNPGSVTTSGVQINDGEMCCTENINTGKIFAIGETVTAADENSVTIVPQMTQDGSKMRRFWTHSQVDHDEFWSPAFGDIMVMVVYGRGAGQIRRMGEYDIESCKIGVTEPWDVIPDETSHIMVTTCTYQTVYYNNNFENGEKGVWFYGGGVDSIMAENNLVEVEGLVSFGFHIDSYSASRFLPNYYVSFRDNTIEGISQLGGTSGIAIYCSNESSTNSAITKYYAMTDNFACDIRNNTHRNALGKRRYTRESEAPDYGGIMIGSPSMESVDPYAYKPSPHNDSSKAYIVEGNNLTNTAGGISIKGSGSNRTQGILVKDNELYNTRERVVQQAGVTNVVTMNQR